MGEEIYMSMVRVFPLAIFLTVAAAGLPGAAQQGQGQIPGSAQSANAIGRIQNPRDSEGRPNADPARPTPTPQELQENANAIRSEVGRLCELASELKADVDKADPGKILSTSLAKKAQQIEKLAKDIKSRSKD